MVYYVLEVHYCGRKAELALLHRRTAAGYVETFLQDDLQSLDIPREPAAIVTSFWRDDVPVVRCSWNAEHPTDDLDALHQALVVFTPTARAIRTTRMRKVLNDKLRELQITVLTAEFRTEPVAVKQEVADDGIALWGAAKENAPPGHQDAPANPGHRSRVKPGALKTALDTAIAAAGARLEALGRDVEARQDDIVQTGEWLDQYEAQLQARQMALRERGMDSETANARKEEALTRVEAHLSETLTALKHRDTQIADARTQRAKVWAQLADKQTNFVKGRMQLTQVTAERDLLAQKKATLQADLVQARMTEDEQQARHDTIASLRAELGTLGPEVQAVRAAIAVTEEELRQLELSTQAEIERQMIVERNTQILSEKFVQTQLDLMGEALALRQHLDTLMQQLEDERAVRRRNAEELFSTGHTEAFGVLSPHDVRERALFTSVFHM
ncbi:uncharacterized protein B0H18DRAFT_1126477 [Fomitopsis serialis]|uniref:uncharacterized protein n=1 Tax=Fomitopsis serialis TaxID=139415 RepID=UPI002008BF3F|nr:uncharacterized protein B0H18DRAFT_1126477 [Neoantrodia serialis]KAH9913236.1 hypothetical protein B0H18DRAFT_1126477 [Neoantrodia serialis]